MSDNRTGLITETATTESAGPADDAIAPALDTDDPRVARTRQAVHEAGRDLLIESGPAALTHAAVASAARISRTTLYKYWPTRSDLVADICRSAKPDDHIEPSGDIRSDLIHMTSHVAEHLRDREMRKMFASMVAESQWDDDQREALSAMIGLGMADLRTMLDAAVAAGEVRPGIDPERAASRMLGPIFFAAAVIDIELDDDDLVSIVDDWLASVRP